jgi:CRISPR-associated protein Cas10/Csm1 subtype III-A
MTAALAACLAEMDTNNLEALLASVRREFRGEASAQDVEVLNQPVALLVGGDISGIQKFIYTISSKGAARMLRGRSFYLQLLTEALLRYTLVELGLPYSNVIYSGGGHFYLTGTAFRQRENTKPAQSNQPKTTGTTRYQPVSGNGLRSSSSKCFSDRPVLTSMG